MESTYREKIEKPYIVDEEGVKKIYDLLKRRIGPVQIEIDCADSSQRVMNNADPVKELFSYENIRSKEIQTLEMSARSEDFKKRASISFSQESYSSGININITGPADIVDRLKEKLIELFQGVVPWYHRIQRFDFRTFFVSGFAWGFLSLLVLLYGFPMEGDWELKITCLVIFLGMSYFMFNLGAGANKIRDSIFPRAVYLVGQGVKRHRDKEKFRGEVVVALGVSLVAGIILLLFQFGFGFLESS